MLFRSLEINIRVPVSIYFFILSFLFSAFLLGLSVYLDG